LPRIYVSIFLPRKKEQILCASSSSGGRLKNHRGDGSKRELRARHFFLEMHAQSFFFSVFDADIRVNTHFIGV